MTTTSGTHHLAAPESGTTLEILRDLVQQSTVTIASCSHAMTSLAATSGTIAGQAKRIAKQADEIREAATSAADKLKEDAIRGQKSLSSIAQEMAGGAQQAEQAQSTISTLHSAIQAIEAARAGEVGKSFTVVASEVRQLSSSSS